MRIVIESTDRIGISQEILAVFSSQAWNLKAVEITSCFTYLEVDYQNLTLSHIKQGLRDIDGLITVREINLLPNEQRASHLQALLDKIPEPIFDLDHHGHILAMNKASHDLLSATEQAKNDNRVVNSVHTAETFIGKPIEQFITQLKPTDFNQNTNDTLTMSSSQSASRDAVSRAISIEGKAYILDTSPVITQGVSPEESSHQNHVQNQPTQQVVNNFTNTKQLSGSVLLLRSMHTLGRQISLLQSHQEHSFENIVGESKSMRLIKAQGQRFAALDLPVLISGETGTGKELIARALHESSGRSKAPFLALNCSALPEHLLESELFGYASGAFTGAQKGGKPGLIELAEGGCLFLDEIAEMSPYLQAKLLRFLQDLHYRRVGGTKELKANIRIISASHQNLVKLIQEKTFREDLYYRLNVLSIELPPLRERDKDISLLAQLFVENAVKQVNTNQLIKTAKPKLTENALKLLQEFSWPGNIRQLQSVLFSVVALNNGNVINDEELRQVLKKHGSSELSQDTYFAQKNTGDKQDNCLAENSNNQSMFIAQVEDWASAQATFEQTLLQHFYPLYPTTRKLAERLKVSHNKIAMKLRQHQLK